MQRNIDPVVCSINRCNRCRSDERFSLPESRHTKYVRKDGVKALNKCHWTYFQTFTVCADGPESDLDYTDVADFIISRVREKERELGWGKGAP